MHKDIERYRFCVRIIYSLNLKILNYFSINKQLDICIDVFILKKFSQEVRVLFSSSFLFLLHLSIMHSSVIRIRRGNTSHFQYLKLIHKWSSIDSSDNTGCRSRGSNVVVQSSQNSVEKVNIKTALSSS